MSSNQGWTSEESVDWDNVSTEPPPPLAVGIYKGLITKAEPQPTKEHKPAIALQLQISEEYGGSSIEPARKMFDNVTLSKEAAFRVKQLAASAGVEPPATFKFQDVEAFCVSLVEAGAVYLRSKHATFNGKTNHKVDRYLTEEQAGEAANALSGNASATESEETPRRGRRRTG